MNEISAFVTETPESSLPPSPCEDTMRRWPSMNQEVGARQTPNQDSTLILDSAASRTMR